MSHPDGVGLYFSPPPFSLFCHEKEGVDWRELAREARNRGRKVLRKVDIIQGPRSL